MLMSGTPPTRRFTGDDSNSARCRYGNTIAEIDTRMKPRMNPKIPTSVANEGIHTKPASAAIAPTRGARPPGPDGMTPQTGGGPPAGDIDKGGGRGAPFPPPPMYAED